MNKKLKIILFYKYLFSIITFSIIFAGWLITLLNLNYVQDFYKKNNNNFLNYFYLNGMNWTLHFFGFFTIQSNILCAFYLLFSAIFYKKEGKVWWLSQKFALYITIYILITGMIFNFILMPVEIIKYFHILNKSFFTPYNIFLFFREFFEHLIMPIIFTIYYMFLLNKKIKFELKEIIKKHIWYCLIYPISWLIINIFIAIFINIGLDKEAFHLNPNQSYYQYFFMDISSYTFGVSNIIILIWVVIIIFLIFIFFIWFLNKFSRNYTLQKQKNNKTIKLKKYTK